MSVELLNSCDLHEEQKRGEKRERKREKRAPVTDELRLVFHAAVREKRSANKAKVGNVRHAAPGLILGNKDPRH